MGWESVAVFFILGGGLLRMGTLTWVGLFEDLYFGILLALSVSFFLTIYDVTTAAFSFLPDLWVFDDTFFLFGMGR